MRREEKLTTKNRYIGANPHVKPQYYNYIKFG